MRYSHALSLFSFIFRSPALLLFLFPALSIYSQIPGGVGMTETIRPAFSSYDDPGHLTDSEDRHRNQPGIDHVDGHSTCIPGIDLVIPDNNSNRQDTFHHRGRLVTTPEMIENLKASPAEKASSHFFVDETPQFISFRQKNNFQHFLKQQEHHEFEKMLKYEELTEPADVVDADDDDPSSRPQDRFHWKPAIEQSLMLVGVQHGYALIAQEKTRRALKGPFFLDYWRSLKGLSGWDDGNRFFTNYVAHPMQGAMTGFIYIQNHDRVKKQKFAESPEYWRDRLKVFVWSTAWSTQWELGPISQSAIGNLGMHGGMAYVDLVVTPTAGTAWLMTEEAIDRYVIRHIESKNMFVKIVARMFLNPMRTTSNLLRFKEPWYRDRSFGH